MNTTTLDKMWDKAFSTFSIDKNLYKLVIYSFICIFFSTVNAASKNQQLTFAPPKKLDIKFPETKHPRYISPHAVDWNDDGVNDMLVGLVGGTAKVGVLAIRVYVNHGTNDKPKFTDFHILKEKNGKVIRTGHTCCGAPCIEVTDLNDDGKKDLLVASSRIRLYTNSGSNAKPEFDSPQYINVGGKMLQFTCHGYPSITDWNDDGKQDIVYSLYLWDRNGQINVLLNKGTNAKPVYAKQQTIESAPGNKIFPHQFAAVVVFDLDGDGKKDLLIGEHRKDGLVWYKNIGTNKQPAFNGFKVVKDSAGNPVKLGGVLRPQIVRWDSDDIPDLIIGASASGNRDNAVWVLKGSYSKN